MTEKYQYHKSGVDFGTNCDSFQMSSLKFLPVTYINFLIFSFNGSLEFLNRFNSLLRGNLAED